MAKHTIAAETYSYVPQTNCHNCGAPITSSMCEYCGTKFNIISDNTSDYKEDFEKSKKEFYELRTSEITTALKNKRLGI